MKHSFLDQPSRLRPELTKREVLRDVSIGTVSILAVVAFGILSDDDSATPAPTTETPPISYLDLFSD